MSPPPAARVETIKLKRELPGMSPLAAATTAQGLQPPAPEDADPYEALNQYVDSEIGGVEWETKVNGAKRGQRARGGAYHGMSQPQAIAAAAEKFRGLAPAERQRFHERGKSLRYQPPGAQGLKSLRENPDDELVAAAR